MAKSEKSSPIDFSVTLTTQCLSFNRNFVYFDSGIVFLVPRKPIILINTVKIVDSCSPWGRALVRDKTDEIDTVLKKKN